MNKNPNEIKRGDVAECPDLFEPGPAPEIGWGVLNATRAKVSWPLTFSDLVAEFESRKAPYARVIVGLSEVVNAGSRFVECPKKLFRLVLQRNFAGRALNFAAGL